MAIITTTQILEARDLPPAMRRGIGERKLVRVVVEELTEIPLSPDKEAETIRALADAREGKSVSRRFDRMADAIDFLDSDEASRLADSKE